MEFSHLYSVRDFVFTFYATELRGTGLYEFRLTDVAEPRIILAREFIEVKRV